MCFVLYAGTEKPIPRKEFRVESPGLCVESLGARDAPIASHFSKPHVQYIGSTSQCGCDFPHVTYQNGTWPWYEDEKEDHLDGARKETEQQNREALVGLLRQSKEPSIELYGVWDGDFTTSPANREEISFSEILVRDFRFKELGFYTVHLTHDGSQQY